MSEPSPASTFEAPKRCCHCGKDLTGHTRYKTHEGYFCKACNAEHEFRKTRMHEKPRYSTGLIVTLASLGVVLVLVLYLWLR